MWYRYFTKSTGSNHFFRNKSQGKVGILTSTSFNFALRLNYSSVSTSTNNCHETIKITEPESGRVYEVHPVWLRHHCLCNFCYNPSTHQRNTIPSNLVEGSQINDIRATPNELLISWSDGHNSNYNFLWLAQQEHAIKTAGVASSCVASNSETNMYSVNFPSLPSNLLECGVSCDEFMRENDEGVGKLLQNIINHGYGIVKNVPPDFHSTKKVVLKISHPQNTIFGDFSKWTSNLQHADTAYTADYVHLHTDTSYFTEPMGLQMFHCLKHDGEGGMNSIVDGFAVAKRLSEYHGDLHRALHEMIVPYQYLDPGKSHFLAAGTILSINSLTEQIQRIRYNPHDLGIINTVPHSHIGLFYEALITLSQAIEESPSWLKLVPGVVIFLDNWRLLHGRSEFTGSRTLCGAYISRSDWLSKARVLGLAV